MNQAIPGLCLAVVTATTGFSCTAGNLRLTSGRSALLPSSQAQELLDQCSRPVPRSEGGWEPSGSDIARLEKDLPRFIGRKASTCCINGAQLRDVHVYFRQYVGVIVRGRPVIYINAFPASEFDSWPSQIARPDVTREPFKACDGGSAFWGAISDPEHRAF
jgi:hypothetical protein